MGTYFLDTSAIVKRYVPAEQGHAWVVALCHPAQGHKLFISQAALVEVVATICRNHQETFEFEFLPVNFRDAIRQQSENLQKNE